jgi:hypothetical protein
MIIAVEGFRPYYRVAFRARAYAIRSRDKRRFARRRRSEKECLCIARVDCSRVSRLLVLSGAPFVGARRLFLLAPRAFSAMRGGYIFFRGKTPRDPFGFGARETHARL